MKQPDLDPVWRALANPTRRSILDLLREGPSNTMGLVVHFPELSRFAVMQHLRVLAEGNLVVRKKVGRETMNHFNPVPIQQIYDRWVRRFHQPWAEALVDMKHEIESEQ
jgi:DNA-binding transcriptional ArsR family regulator